MGLGKFSYGSETLTIYNKDIRITLEDLELIMRFLKTMSMQLR